MLSTEEYVGLRFSLSEEYQDISDNELFDLVETNLMKMTQEQEESFWSTVKKVGSKALKVGTKAVPGIIQGVSTGSVAGPWGAIAGGVIGGVSGALSKQKSPGGLIGGVSGALSKKLPMASIIPGLSNTPASSKLLQLVQSPLVSQALTSLNMGSAGRQAIPVGKNQVPIGDIMNLLSVLASSASKEATEAYASSSEDHYFLSDSNEYLSESDEYFDPAIPEHRAEALWNYLQRQEEFRDVEDSSGEDFSELFSESGPLILKLR